MKQRGGPYKHAQSRALDDELQNTPVQGQELAIGAHVKAFLERGVRESPFDVG